MKVGNFVQTIVDIQDLLSYFTNVKTKDQMISALERIKRQEAEGFLDTVSSLQNSFEAITADEIETPSADEIESLLSETVSDGQETEEKKTEEPKEGSTPIERLGI
jgi:spore cortex formation protein SpoVR/YcgB (stage V sporulation)